MNVAIDWNQLAEDRFRRCIQEASATGFNTAPLFPAEEEVSVTFPCHWLSEDRTLPVGTQLTIFQRGDRARVAVLYGTEAVGEIRGEAATDLKNLFRDHPNLQNALGVKIVRVGKPAEPFYVQPISRAKGKRITQ